MEVRERFGAEIYDRRKVELQFVEHIGRLGLGGLGVPEAGGRHASSDGSSGGPTREPYHRPRLGAAQLCGEQRNILDEEAAAHVEAHGLKQKPSSPNHIVKFSS